MRFLVGLSQKLYQDFAYAIVNCVYQNNGSRKMNKCRNLFEYMTRFPYRFHRMRPKYEMFFLSTALFLLLAFFQSSQCMDINNDSSVIETVGDDSLDKAATIMAEGMASIHDGQVKSAALPLDGKATRSRYFKSFGGAGDPNLSIYSFGLGKRTSRSYSINPYSFGLGKRGGGNVKNYPQNPYSFGLGKRNPMYNFGLGKRADRYVVSDFTLTVKWY